VSSSGVAPRDGVSDIIGSMNDRSLQSAPGPSAPPAPPLWREVQHFRQWWIWTGVLSVAVFMWVGFVTQIIIGHRYGSKPAPDVILIVFTALFGVGFPVFFFMLRLVTEVYADHLRVGLAPFRRRAIRLRDIASAEAVTYHPLADYGGWGVRWAGSRGMAYNVSGNRGVQLVLADGRRILVGSQRAEELAMALRLAAGPHLQNPNNPSQTV
jgi:hypothetical protein